MDTFIQNSIQGLIDVGVFGIQAVIILAVIAAVILLIAGVAAKAAQKPELEVEILNKKLKSYKKALKALVLNKKQLKEDKKKSKAEAEAEENQEKKRLYVLNFDGDIRASHVEQLREEISAVLTMATPEDEVLVKVKSPGGVVNGYGLAAAQLLRIREKNIPLTICVDEVAASGGYMMAVVANKIVAAPFAIVGSIGVVAQVPNFNKLLKKYDVDYKEYTAGDYKRTISIFGEITEKGEKKFLSQLEDTHSLFKHFVGKYRPQLDLASVTTGEYWFAEQAIGLKLVDELGTSDAYLLEKAANHLLIQVKFAKKQNLGDKLSSMLSTSIKKAVLGSFEELESRTY